MAREGERPRKNKNRATGERRHRNRDRDRVRPDRNNANQESINGSTSHTAPRHQESSDTAQDSDIDYTNSSTNPYLDNSLSHSQTTTNHIPQQQAPLRPSLSSSTTSTTTDHATLLHLCDHATPTTWDTIRTYLRTHSAHEANLAASHRGDYDTAPLHLACRNDPPPDIIELLLIACPSMVSSADSFGWLPLHYACANDAREEVLTLLVAEYPESTRCVDKRKRTALHFALGRTERMVGGRIVQLLGSMGAAQMADENGMLPLHYACAYGATEEALRVLTDDNIVTITATDHRGRTPLHFALGNADRPDSPTVVNLLLSQTPTVANIIDSEEKLPIELLSTRSKAIGEYATEQRTNCEKCLHYYLKANPEPTAKLLVSLQGLPDWLREKAVLDEVVQGYLNEKMQKAFPTAITLADFVFYFLVIIFFQFSVIESIQDRVEQTDNLNHNYLNGLYLSATYFILRELIQAISMYTIDLFSTWVWDRANWFDLFYIFLVLFWAVVMNQQSLDENTFRIGSALTLAVYWLNVLTFLKSIVVGFAVFVGGVMLVVERLAAFLLALIITLLAFAQIFYTLARMSDFGQCYTGDLSEYIHDPSPPDKVYNVTNGVTDVNVWVIPEVEICEPVNENPWCNFWTSFYKCISMLLGEVDDNDFEGSEIATVFFCLFQLGVVIILSNVLIAIVTDSYGVIKNEKAAMVFWGNRLDFVAEMDVIGNNVSNIMKNFTNAFDDDNAEKLSLDFILGEVWKKFMYHFDAESDYQYTGTYALLYNLLRFGICFIVIPSWLIIGLATFGILWPPQVRKYLLTNKVTTHVDKGEEEKYRLESCESLMQDVSRFHDEVKKDIDQGKDDIANLRLFVTGARAEISTEMKDVKRIVMELYEKNLD